MIEFEGLPENGHALVGVDVQRDRPRGGRGGCERAHRADHLGQVHLVGGRPPRELLEPADQQHVLDEGIDPPGTFGDELQSLLIVLVEAHASIIAPTTGIDVRIGPERRRTAHRAGDGDR